MATYEEMYETFTAEMNETGIHHHEELYHEILKYLGDSIHDRDANLVACSDKAELDVVKKDFLIGKLGLDDSPELDDLLDQVCGAMGKSNRTKHRATFYYLCTAISGNEHIFIESKALPYY
jgi:hypothetical protein